MKNNSKLKLLEGALAGAVLGAVAGLLLAPESGKKMRKDLKKKSAEFYNSLVPQLKKMGKMGEADYRMAIKKAMSVYSKAKKLSSAETKELTREAEGYWKQIKKHF
ncbi:MAG: YtxH domain-containing protein [Candidatus Buchananbacteria bacterium]|nr:YtxH domain-containing protein [Candidatus Buchananbacteria bacterium]